MRKIVIFGLPFSPNVGDGAIAECLSAQIKVAGNDVEVQCIDISGRTGFGAVTVKNRSTALAILRMLPAPLAQKLVTTRLSRMLDRFEPLWREAAATADLAIIGGGQIFSDADLNFCLKIDRVAQILKDLDCPVVVHAAGVALNWSPQGRSLFRSLLDCDLRAVGLRDAPSIKNWCDQIGNEGPSPTIARDPALLASEVFQLETVSEQRIGLCVTDPAILSYHAEGQKSSIQNTDWFVQIALTIIERGHKISLFCNGAAEDRLALSAVQSNPSIATAISEGLIRVEPSPETPTELALIIGRQKAVVAHRLHACILGYAFQRPIVGLGWDRKLESFFHSVGLQDFFLPVSDITPANTANLVDLALKTGIDATSHAAAIEETRSAINLLLAIRQSDGNAPKQKNL